MKIIAKTGNGYHIVASEREVESILSAVSKAPTRETPINIGDDIPAFDYAAVIMRTKDFTKSQDYTYFKERFEIMVKSGKALIDKLDEITL